MLIINKKQHMVMFGNLKKNKLEYYLEKDLSLQEEDIIFNINKFKQFIGR